MSLIEKSEFVLYSSPTEGFLSYIPSPWIPYAELMRIHKPMGILYTYFPSLFGSLFAACLQQPVPLPKTLVIVNIQLFAIAFTLRSVGCTWNDIVDRNLDCHVTRCSNRPMARGALSLRAGYIFTAAQYLVLFTIVVSISQSYLPYLAPVIVTGTFYPYAKRVTNYAQVVLGLSFSLSTLIGCAVMETDPLGLGLSRSSVGFLCLTASYIAWTVSFDTIYAFQDIRDDKKAGIKAMSIRHEGHMKPLLFGLSMVQVVLLFSTGLMIGAGWAYFSGIFCTATLLMLMVWTVDLGSPRACWWWFKYGSLLIGGSLTLSLQGEYVRRL